MKPTIHELFDRAAKQAGFRVRQVGALTLLEAAPDKPDAERPAKVRHKLTGGNGHAKAKAGR